MRRPHQHGMDPIRTLIVDDEPLARENLRLRLAGQADFIIIGECANGRETLAAVEVLRPELMFLDIRLPDLNGFEVIEGIPPERIPVIVFVTAYDRFAIDAFSIHALDYLLKPFDDKRFARTLAVCRERIAGLRVQASESDGDPVESSPRLAAIDGGEYLERFIIKNRGLVFFVPARDLDWIAADGDYVRLHQGERSYLLRKTMNEIENRLDPRTFARISRSVIVNLDRVGALRTLSHGEYGVQLTCGRELKLTRSYRDRLRGWLRDRG